MAWVVRDFEAASFAEREAGVWRMRRRAEPGGGAVDIWREAGVLRSVLPRRRRVKGIVGVGGREEGTGGGRRTKDGGEDEGLRTGAKDGVG